MTHLRIEQNNGIIEEVSSSVITKLYEIAHAGLDVSSNLLGRLHVAATYLSYVTYLTTNYPELYILSDDYYVEFADPEVARIFASSNYGNGNGLLLSTVLTITNLNNVTISGTGSLFKNNTTIEHFDELGLFTSIVELTNSPFYGTTNLKSIDLSNILFINQECFKKSGLTGTINLPSLKLTQPYPFHSCNSITQLNFSSSLTNPDSGLCANMTGLQTVTGLSHVTKIVGALFANDTSLSSIDIDWSKITYIGDSAFLSCNSLILSNLSIPNLTTINSNAFRYNTALLKVSNLGSITSIPQECFNGCTGLASITLPSTLTILGSKAFYGCSSLTGINLSNVVFIGESAFNRCTGLLSVTLSGNLTKMADSCFMNCTSLTSLTIPESVTEIQNQAFRNCTSLTSLTLPTTNPLTINELCFSECRSLESVGDTSNCTYFGQGAFSNCSKLAEVNLVNATYIGNSAFYRCVNLTTINCNLTKVETIGESAFRECSNISLLSTINLPNLKGSLHTSFMNCTQIQHITSLGSLSTLHSVFGNDGAFFGCSGLLDVVLPETLTSIGLCDFGNCRNIRYIKILATSVPTYQLVDGFDNIRTYGSSFGEQYRNGDVTNEYMGYTYPIYVKDELLSQYQAADGWKYVGPNRLRPLSQFATDFPNG